MISVNLEIIYDYILFRVCFFLYMDMEGHLGYLVTWLPVSFCHGKGVSESDLAGFSFLMPRTAPATCNGTSI